MPQDNIYRSLALMFLPGDLLNYFEVVNFKEELTGKEVMNGYPEKILHIYLDETEKMRPSDSHRPMVSRRKRNTRTSLYGTVRRFCTSDGKGMMERLRF